MRVGIIGGGPAGLYLAKYLSKYNHLVTIFEKESGIGGMYKYAQLPPNKLDSFKKIISSKNVKLVDNCEINRENFAKIENDFDAFVLATGGKPVRHNFRSKNILYAIDVIKEPKNIGKNVLILGMGNVSMDLIRLLFRERNFGVKSIDVVTRSSVDNSKFTNSELRDVVALEDIKITVIEKYIKPSSIKSMIAYLYSKIRQYFVHTKSGNELKKVDLAKESVSDYDQRLLTNTILSDRIKDRRRQILANIPNNTSSRSLRLIFNTNVESIQESGNSFKAKFKNGLKKTYDTVISSMGFRSNPMRLNTTKPVFKVGWCDKPTGNINDALIQAKLLSLDIDDFLKRKD
ncbi:Glutamate synthase NADPH small chain [Nosema bombycis CQ1]|uniref:Glutamate synthase NADPH small chain n=1 Tax=Nosema bombycis (strain CQ1 / CVCC 102059) TaxID=578461 RepID=R0KSF5_NOSB1|nr:Glutamate synthase NADPH small chain [Nosema bombycis CQ1]|eukprot:EOB13701.1 Glutamate synthase NADPH small chain [Nosema bombycis CQ1]